MRTLGKRLIWLIILAWAAVVAQSDFPGARTADPAASEKSSPAASPQETTSPPVSAAPDGESKGPVDKAAHAAPPTVADDTQIFYVRDKQGRLIPLLGFSYEDLLKFIEQKAGGNASAEQPQYSLQQLVITGQAKGDQAELEAVYKIQLDSTGSVEMPLVGGGAVLREPEKYQGPGEHALVFDAAGGSYRLRLRGDAKSEHQITLKIAAPIKTIAGQHRLEMTLPAAAASRLSLRWPDANITVSNHTGAATADVKAAGGGSEINLLGLGGPLSLAWKETTGAESSPPVLEATGEVLARIDSRSVQFEAVLSVRSFGAEFDRFRVKLPRGAQWVGSEPAPQGYTLAASGDASQQIVEVQLAQKTAGPVEIRLRAERAYDVTKPDETLELAGFEVLEAVPHRQWGHLAVAVTGDWQVTWGRRDRMQQVDDLPDWLRRKDVVAGFEYFGQPAALAVRITPRKTRISVEPEYVYFVESQQVRLEARLKYAIRGAKAFALDVGLAGWQIDEIGPAGTVDSDAALASTGPVVKAPLLQATTGDVEVTIKAHRGIPADAKRVELTLPTLFADVQGPALVAVAPADNVHLHPVDAELVGLRREAALPGMKLPPRQQAAFFYRGEQAAAKFVGEIQRMPQVVSAAVDSTIEVRHEELRVDQSIKYRVEHEPLAALSLEVPKALLSADAKWELLLEGQPLAITPATAGEAASARIDVPLPNPKIGDFEVQVRSQWPETALTAAANGERTVPLVMPAGGALTGNTLTIDAEAGIAVQAHDPAWTEAEGPKGQEAAGGGGALQLSAAQGATEITLNIGRADRRGKSDTVVDRAWVQTWLTGAGRQDRAVYRFSGGEQPIEVSLPPGVSAGNVEARLDGQSVPIVATSEQNLAVRLDPRGGHQHVLELQYQFDDRFARMGAIEAQLPRFNTSVWMQRMYWQLILPGDRHLLSGSSELSLGVFLDLVGLVLGPQGADGSGGIGRVVRRSEKLHRRKKPINICSAWRETPSGLRRSVERGQIVMIASLAVLCVGLLLLYLPAIRRPATLLVGGVLLLALAAWNADLALLLAQASVLGVALVFLSGYLEYAVARRRRGAVVAAHRQFDPEAKQHAGADPRIGSGRCRGELRQFQLRGRAGNRAGDWLSHALAR